QSLSRDEPPRVEQDAILMKGMRPGPIAWLPGGDEILAGAERVALDGSPPRPLRLPEWRWAHEWEPWGLRQRWSVRGMKLAFDTAGLRPQLLRVALAGGTKGVPAPFFASSRGEEDPAFAPDGRRVAFASLRSGDRGIWTGEADGSACRELPLPSGSRYPG